MTTPPPTGPEAGSEQFGTPSWLPDEATLNRLAGEFFAALPGGPGVATLGVAEPSVPSSPPSGTAPPGGPTTEPRVPDRNADVPRAGPPPETVADPLGAYDLPSIPVVPQPVPQGSGYPSAPGTQAGVSPPSGPPSATAGTGYASTAAGLTDVFTPEIPTALGPQPAVPEVGPSQAYYFLSGSRVAPASPGRSIPGFPDIPMVAGPDPVATPTPGAQPQFYFLAERPESVPGVPTTDEVPAGGADTSVDLPSLRSPGSGAFDVEAVRADFPILTERVNGYPLVWFDNAATTQKPRQVIERLSYFYEHENSNIHRAAHELAARSTDAYERARDTVARFLGADAEEIVFVRGATEAINLVAQSWGRKHIGEGDEILLSQLEHHANIVPWQMLAAETGAVLKVIPVDDRGQLLMGEYTRLLSERTKLVSVTQVSNALGTVTPVHDIVEQGHRAGATVLIDGAQSVPHTKIDLHSLGADFFVFSGHKIYGPTGIGALFGRAEVLADTPPWQGGGNMISDVTFERSLYQPPPGRFEAGTGNIADAVGLGAALEYVERLGIETIARYEHDLLAYATPLLAAVPGVRLVGTAAEKASVLSFVMDGYEPLEVGKALNEKGIAVRAGHHCAQPILRRFGLKATVRPSLAFYNTCGEVDRMIEVLHQLAADRGRR